MSMKDGGNLLSHGHSRHVSEFIARSLPVKYLQLLQVTIGPAQYQDRERGLGVGVRDRDRPIEHPLEGPWGRLHMLVVKRTDGY